MPQEKKVLNKRGKKRKTNSTLRRWNVALSVKKNLSTSSQKNYNSAATIYKVDLGSKSLVAFGPSIPHKNQQKKSPDDVIFFLKILLPGGVGSPKI